MLNTLKFVRGAVSSKSFVPAMSHFQIRDGRITSFNGMFSISAPIDFDLNCNPKADTLVKAIGHCTKTVHLKLTPTRKLSITSGKFRALIDCFPEALPEIVPDGTLVDLKNDKLYKGLSTIYPIVGEDATRPWANGVMIKDMSMYATNNIILVERWLGIKLPEVVNIPKLAIREVLRVAENPASVQLSRNSLTFHYHSGAWIRTQLLDTGWPDSIGKLLVSSDKSISMPAGFFKSLEQLKDFMDDHGRIHLRDGHLSTRSVDDKEGSGAEVEIDGLVGTGFYNYEMLTKLKTVANQIDFTAYPKAVPFTGDELRGIIAGMRPV
jgi:DNA polymerase III sliding clamp (beta) subunit (PCNA family)